MYHAQLLLKDGNDFSLDALSGRLAEAFPDAAIDAGDATLQLDTDDWEIAFAVESGPEVLEQAQSVAERITGADDPQGIGTCRGRVDFRSDIPDPEMEHFDKFQNVLDVMRTFQNAILIDPREPCLL